MMCDKIYLLFTRRNKKVKNKLKIISVICTILTLLFVIFPTVAFATEENTTDGETTTTTPSIEELDTRSASVYIGEEYQIPSDIFTNPKYESLNSDVASVNSAGVVTGVSAGSTTIVISDSKYTQMYIITVEEETTKAPNTTIKTLPTISSTKFITLEKGKTTTLSPSLSGYIVYSSGNTSIVYVTSKGVVRAVGTGTTYIQAHNGSYVQNYQITVKPSEETTSEEESTTQETISSELNTVSLSNTTVEEETSNNENQANNTTLDNAQKQRNRLIVIACVVALIILVIIIILIVKYFSSRKYSDEEDDFDNNNDDDYYYFNDFDNNDSQESENDITQSEDKISLDDFIDDDDDDDFFI